MKVNSSCMHILHTHMCVYVCVCMCVCVCIQCMYVLGIIQYIGITNSSIINTNLSGRYVNSYVNLYVCVCVCVCVGVCMELFT